MGIHPVDKHVGQLVYLLIGRKFERERKLLDISEADMAEKLKISLNMVHRYESGLCPIPYMIIALYGYALDRKPSYFLKGIEFDTLCMVYPELKD